MLMNLIRQEARHIALPDGEDGIILRLFVLTQYRRVTDTQTDRQTDGHWTDKNTLARLL